MGEQQWGEVDERVRRISTAFSGGLGGTHDELCGALSGGTMVIGATLGRASSAEDNVRCKALAAEYRQTFQQTFKHTICADLRSNGWGGAGTSCRELVAQAAGLLLDVLAEAEKA